MAENGHFGIIRSLWTTILVCKLYMTLSQLPGRKWNFTRLLATGVGERTEYWNNWRRLTVYRTAVVLWDESKLVFQNKIETVFCSNNSERFSVILRGPFHTIVCLQNCGTPKFTPPLSLSESNGSENFIVYPACKLAIFVRCIHILSFVFAWIRAAEDDADVGETTVFYRVLRHISPGYIILFGSCLKIVLFPNIQ